MLRSCVRSLSTFPSPSPSSSKLYALSLELLKQKQTTLAEQIPKAAESIRPKLELDLALLDRKTLWDYKHEHFDLANPLGIRLAERHWKEHRLADMQKEMFLLEDYVPKFEAKVDVRVTLQGDELPLRMSACVPSDKTMVEPSVEIRTFSKGETFYTLLMVDPDEPDEAMMGYKQMVYWAVANVNITPQDGIVNEKGKVLIEFMMPHPAKGSGKHRYVFLALKQPGKIENPAISNADNFDLCEYLKITKTQLEGVGQFRVEWDKNVSEIYKILHKHEPYYGRLYEPGRDGNHKNKP